MKLIIENDIKVLYPTKPILDYCRNVLTLDNPDYIEAKKMGRYLGNIDPQLKLYSRVGEMLVLPFGTLQNIWKYCSNCEYEYKIHSFIGNNLMGSINLYDYQQNALNCLKSGKNGVLEAPCGSGKTQIGLAFIKSVGGRALWLTHTKDLLTQSMDRAKQYFTGDFGTITEGKVNIGKDITFATVQTMRDLDTSLYKDAFDIIVVDETHRAVGSPTRVMQFYKVISNCSARYKIGLSATLDRADNLINSVYALLGNKLYSIDQKEVGDKIIKAKHNLVEWGKDYRILDYSDFDGTLNYNKLITLLSDDTDRNRFIADKVIELDKLGKKQLILCSRISQVDELYNLLEGLERIKITGNTKSKDRVYDKADIVITTFSLAKEGLDIVRLDVVHFASPQKDKSTVKQSAGRVERNYEGKQTPIIMDYVDTKIPYCLGCYRKRKNILK